MQVKKRGFVTVCAAVGLLLAVAAQAQVVYVDADASGPSHTGASWCAAFLTLDEALAVAGSGTTIRMADGTYTPDASGLPSSREATFRLLDGVTVEGGYAGCGATDPDERDPSAHETVLSGDLAGNDAAYTDGASCVGAGGTWFSPANVCSAVGNNGENSYHVVTYDTNNATAVLDGVTVSGGNANGTLAGGPSTPAFSNQGAAVHIHDGDPMIDSRLTLRNCVFRGNRGTGHGAVNDHGSAANSTTILDSVFVDNYVGGKGAALYVHSGAPAVTGCQFTGNATSGEGGAMFNNAGSDPQVTDCFFTDNVAAAGGGGIWNQDNGSVITQSVFSGNAGGTVGGGGVYNSGSDALIDDCVFVDNVSEGGSGVYNLSSDVRISNSEFIGNLVTGIVTYGGGVYNNASSPVIIGCTFTGNHANFAGGAIYAGTGGTPVVVNSKFVGNSAATGGAFATDGGSQVFVNSEFRNNSGAAMSIFWATTEIINCTLIDNSSAAVSYGNAGGSATITNSILWNNTPDQILDPNSRITVTYSDVEGGWPGTHNLNADPQFLDRPEVLHLTSGSPGIDAGDNEVLVRGFCITDADCVDGLESCLAGSCRIVYDASGCARRVDDPDVILDPGNAGSLGAPVVDLGHYEFRGVELSPPVPEDSLGTTCSQDSDCTNQAVCVQNLCYVPKNRYLSFGSGTPSARVAFQVTLVDSVDFPASVGLAKWVGAPDASGIARLECTPSPVFKDDWPSTIHVGDRDLVPGATYEVRAVLDGADLGDSCSFTPPLRLPTVALWGDCVGPKVSGVWQPPDGVVDTNDINASVEAFQGLLSAPPLPWMDVAPEVPDKFINFTDISRVVDASKGAGYPYGAPSSCP